MATNFPNSPTVGQTHPVSGGATYTWTGTTWDMVQQSSDNGADVVVYTPAGTGAVSTTVKAKLDQITSVKDFGAVGDGVTDDSAAIQAAIDYVRAAYSTAVGEFTVKLDFGGKNYRVESSIDATLIRQPGFTMRNGGLYGAMSGGIVLDLAGTNSMVLQDFRIYGDETTSPDVGILQSMADVSGSLISAGSHKWFNVQCNGFFNKSAAINLASETSSYIGCRFLNRSRSVTAYAFIHSSNHQTLTDYVSGVTSAYVTLPINGDGNKSNVLHYHGQAHIQRIADVNLAISSIDLVNPLEITCDSTALTAEGFTNGDKIFFHNVVGTTELNGNVYTIANLNEGAGTFELSGVDGTTGHSAFTSGTIHNQTGPAMLLAGTDSLKIEDGSYLLTYGSPAIVIDTEQASSCRKNELSFQVEPDVPTVIDFKRATTATQYTVQHLKLEVMNYAQIVGDEFIKITSAIASSIKIDNLDLTITSMGTAPTNGLFSDATKFNLTNAKITTPLAASMNTIADFVAFSGEVYSADDATRTIVNLPVLRMKENAVPNTASGSLRVVNNSWLVYNDTAAAEKRIQIQNTASSTELDDIGDPVNTEDKYTGKMVYNITTNKPVWADGSTAGDIWVTFNATSVTAHTPS